MAIRYLAWFAAAIVTLIVAAALILPGILDTPAVRTGIQRTLSAAVHGEVAWEDLKFRILPAPGGVLRKVRVEIPGRLEVSADELTVRLAFWPLLRGRAEVVSVTLLRPAINLEVPEVQEAHGGPGKDEDPRPDLVRTYRSTAGVLADIVQRFAPETVLVIEDARLEFSAPGILPIALHDVSVRARSGHTDMDVKVSMAGTHWSRVKFAARLQFADLSGDADIEVAGIKPQPWLDHYLGKSPIRIAIAAADVRTRVRTDGKTTLECEFDASTGSVGVLGAGELLEVPEVAVKGKVTAGAQEIAVHLGAARLGPSRLADGVLRYSLKDDSLAGDVGYDLDLAQGMDVTRRLVPASVGDVLSWFQPVTGRAQGKVKLAFGSPQWSVVVDVARSDAAVQVRDLPGPVRLTHAMVEIDRNGVKVSRAAASMPAGQLRLSTLRHTYRDGATTANAEFDVDLTAGMELARRASGNELAVIQSASGRARGSAKLAFGRKDWSVGVDIQKADAQVQVKGLPGPTGLSSGSVHVTPDSVKVDRAVVTLLDTRAIASTTIGFRDELRVQGGIAEGTIGEKFLEWVWRIADAPPYLALKAPISVTSPQFAWGPKGALDVNATARFSGGQSVGVDLAWASGALHVRRATVKDQRSDTVIVARTAGSGLEGQFSGSLHGASIAAMLKSPTPHEGTVSGKLRFAFDRDRPRDATAEGSLKGESLDLSWLILQPVKIERIDLAADGTSLRVGDATVIWAGQRATIRGDVKRGPTGPIIDAQLDSPGIDLDALLKAMENSRKPPAIKRERSRIWPLPVTGKLVMRSNFVQRGRYRVAPVVATLALQTEHARLEFQQAQLCGISLPITIEATPGGLVASAKITAQKQQLQQTAHCLSGENVLITGEFDLNADIVSKGKPGGFARNLQGSVVADLRDGSVMKFALLGNILSMQNVAALMKEGGPRLEAKGFPYRQLKIVGKFDNSRFEVEEGAFRSDAVGLAATGWVSIMDYQSRLLVLVAPFSRLDEIARKVPILGYVMGGTFTSVPVGVSGDIRDPLVVPLSPLAITSELLGIFERTLKLPGKLVAPLEKQAPN